jgi:hypothetical protein
MLLRKVGKQSEAVTMLKEATTSGKKKGEETKNAEAMLLELSKKKQKM